MVDTAKAYGYVITQLPMSSSVLKVNINYMDISI